LTPHHLSDGRKSLGARVFCGLVALLLCIGATRGGTITLTPVTRVSVTGARVEALFEITNSGTDAAKEVMVEARMLDQVQRAQAAAQMEPGEKSSLALPFTLPATARGTFPILTTISYTDAAGSPCSAATYALARTPGASDAPLVISVLSDPDKWGRLTASIAAGLPQVKEVKVTCFCSADLEASPVNRTAAFKDGRASAAFQLQNVRGNPGSSYAVFFIAEYDLAGAHYTAHADHVVPIQAAAGMLPVKLNGWHFLLIAAILLLLAAIVAAGASDRAQELMRGAFDPGSRGRMLIDVAALVLIEVFLLTAIDPRAFQPPTLSRLPQQIAGSYLLTSTTTTGGDTGSHYYTVEYLRHTLLPEGRISCWTPGNYAGFPILQFYFPLPFLTMCGLDAVMPLQVAFKLVSLLGTFLLPACAYLLLRLLRAPFPAPALAAAFMVPFLINPANSMWGGNIMSTLAGEMSYSLSMAISLLFLGCLYRGATEDKWVILNGVLCFFVGFSHGYTLLFVEAMSVFLLLTPSRFTRRAFYLGKVYALGFCLMAFWLVPLLMFSRQTTPYHTVWTINSIWEVTPQVLMPYLLLAAAGTVGLLICGWTSCAKAGKEAWVPYALAGVGGAALLAMLAVDSRLPEHAPAVLPWLTPMLLMGLVGLGGLGGLILYKHSRSEGGDPEAVRPLAFLWFGLLVAGVMFIAAPKLGVVDIRYVPYAQLMACFIAALALGWFGALLHRIGLSWGLLAVGLAATLAWNSTQVGVIPDWCKWNYEGFEAKPAWPLFREINASLKGDFEDPRVVFEHSEEHNVFGTTRAFESLPLFAGRATLEGLYMQASTSSPFVFYIQSLVSDQKSCPFPQYSYATLDYDRARARLEMFNVRDLVLRSNAAKAAIRKVPAYRPTHTHGQYELWQLAEGNGRYVVPLRFEPVLLPAKDWKRLSYQWFLRDDLIDRHLVFADSLPAEERGRFRAAADSLADGLPRIPIETRGCVVQEEIGNREIRLRTNWIGKPLLVKMTYHPNWHVEGAERIYLASPSFMVIYPNRQEVRLYYGWGWRDRVGALLTVIGLGVLLVNIPLPRRRKSLWQLAAERTRIPPDLVPTLPWDPPPQTRWRLFAAGLVLGGLLLAVVTWRLYDGEPNRLFNKGIELKDKGLYEGARAKFRRVIAEVPTAGIASDSAYYIAITYFRQERDAESIAAFEKLLAEYPNCNWAPEAHYHIGISHFRTRREEAGIARMRRVLADFPGTIWAGYAQERLEEHGAGQPGKPEPVEQKFGRAIRYFNEDDHARVTRLCSDIVTNHPDFPKAPQAAACLALAHYKQADYAATVRWYTHLVERYPDDGLVPEAWYHIGVSHERTGDPGQARAAYEKAVARDPSSEYGKRAAEQLRRLRAPR
jgi:TolA-binding protein